MTHQEIRPFPAPATTVMRSTLFALARMNAKLQAYNEDSGVIVATLTKRMGLQKQDLIARIRPFEQTCQLELEAPDATSAAELLRLVAAYVQDGGKVEANARMQWTDLARDHAAKTRRRNMVNRVKAIMPGSAPAPTPPPVAPPSEEDGEMVVGEAGSALMPIPDNPGVLVKNENDKVVELKIDPHTFTDRTAHMQICPACQAVTLRSSQFCSQCGRPLTLEAVQPELREGVEGTAGKSLNAALTGLAFNIVPVALLILPALFRSRDLSFMNRVEAGLSTPIVVAAFLLGLAPMLFFGWRAISHAQRASWFYSLGGAPDDARRTRGMLGSALGWSNIYLAAAWLFFVVIALF